MRAKVGLIIYPPTHNKYNCYILHITYYKLCILNKSIQNSQLCIKRRWCSGKMAEVKSDEYTVRDTMSFNIFFSDEVSMVGMLLINTQILRKIIFFVVTFL